MGLDLASSLNLSKTRRVVASAGRANASPVKSACADSAIVAEEPRRLPPLGGSSHRPLRIFPMMRLYLDST